MFMPVFIVGHKNPDTDSVASAIAYSYLKNKLGCHTLPAVNGEITNETQYVLDRFGISPPFSINNVKTQVKDLKPDIIPGVPPHASILSAYKQMEREHLQTLPILDAHQHLLGIVSMKDIAMGLIKGEFYHIKTSLSNLAADLNGRILAGEECEIKGKISVIAFYYKSIEGSLGPEDIIIVGDRYDIIQHAIDSKVQLIIVTGGKPIPEHYIAAAEKKQVNILSVPNDTYYTSKIIHQCSYISSIMRTKDIIRFNQKDYLEEIKEEMSHSHFRNYPIMNDDDTLAGFINRKHILSPERKQVILVDHNEYAQSVEGLEEAEILEIIDHHKLGDISTNMPITFRNVPVGSTCTIIYYLFKEYRVDMSMAMAGLLLSGILSDTLLFKSPTTTEMDRNASKDLNEVLHLDLEGYAMDMFKAGTSLEGQSIEEIFFKDFKEFKVDKFQIGISQVFTLDIDSVFNQKEEFIQFIQKVQKDNKLDLTMLLVTDILKEGSYLLYECKNQIIIPAAFQISTEQGIFIEQLVSRKKQVIPRLFEAVQLLKK
jgi:manganese-dependent inorganic pyrophosphatase